MQFRGQTLKQIRKKDRLTKNLYRSISKSQPRSTVFPVRLAQFKFSFIKSLQYKWKSVQVQCHFYRVFFSETFTIHRTAGEGEAISLTPLYHCHPLHRHLDISRAITAESSPLHIASSRTGTGKLWFSVLTTSLRALFKSINRFFKYWPKIELLQECIKRKKDCVYVYARKNHIKKLNIFSDTKMSRKAYTNVWV